MKIRRVELCNDSEVVNFHKYSSCSSPRLEAIYRVVPIRVKNVNLFAHRRFRLTRYNSPIQYAMEFIGIRSNIKETQDRRETCEKKRSHRWEN